LDEPSKDRYQRVCAFVTATHQTNITERDLDNSRCQL